MYQVLWVRRLGLVFGTSTLAISTVLAAFMGGLALGGLAMRHRADAVRRPLVAYALLEVGIGVYALLFPLLLEALVPVYVGAWRLLHPPAGLYTLLQFALVAGLLLVPTTLMGATLPLLARFATDRLGAAGDRVGVLYGVNTAGAVLGTWLAGFVLLPAWGWSTTNAAAGGANLVLGGAAFALAAWSRGAAQAPVEEDVDPGELSGGALVVVVAAAAGLASLIYEVAWSRVLGLVVGGSAYAFSVMLLAFLAGIAAGGPLGGRLADRAMARGGVRGVLWALAGVEVAVGVLSFALLYLFPELPYAYVWLFDLLGGARSAQGVWWASLLVAGLVMTPPAVGMGAAFPLAVRAVVRDAGRLGGPVGGIYAANTLGSMIGAFGAGFVLMPLLGIRGTVIAAVLINLGAAAALMARAGRGQGRRVGLIAVAVAGVAALLLPVPWDRMMMTSGMYKYVSSFDDHSREGIESYTRGDFEMVFYEEGRSAVVTVVRNPATDHLWLANNGKVDASSHRDMPTQLMLAAAPMQYVDDLDRALVIGLASGVTAGAVATSDVQRVDVVEIEPAVGRAARLFDEVNFEVLDDPRTRLIYQDGRNVLLRAEPGTWDLVISEPPNPWISGVANLFTKEFFELGRSRLAEGGVWAQWIQTYALSERDLGSLMATFASVYPHLAVYTTPTRADLVVVGSERPLQPGPGVARRLWTDWPELGEALTEAGIEDATEVVALYATDRDGALGLADSAPLNTDDNLRIEYSAPKSLHRATSDLNAAAMVEHRRLPLGSYEGDPDGLAELAHAYREQEDWVRAIRALEHAALQTGDPALREAWMDQARAWAAELRDLAD